MKGNGVSKKDAENFVKKFLTYFRRQMLSFLSGTRRRYIPELYLDADQEEAYTDKKSIHIGLLTKLVESVDELKFFVMYVLGHETQHIRSTSQRPWQWSIMRGIAMTLSAFQRYYGYPVTTPATEDEMHQIVLAMRKDGHIVPSVNAIAQFIHHVHNSVEDGRIERILMAFYRWFVKAVRYFRGKQWLRNVMDEDYPGPDDTWDDTDLFLLLMNEVLSIATTRNHQKGYYDHVRPGDPRDKLVNSLIHDISGGVYAVSCKKCMEHCLKIDEIIIPYFIEYSIKNEEKMLEMLEQLVSQILNAKGKEGFSSMPESQEQKGDEDGAEPMPGSILEIPETDDDGKLTGETKPRETGEESKEENESQSSEQGAGSGKPSESGEDAKLPEYSEASGGNKPRESESKDQNDSTGEQKEGNPKNQEKRGKLSSYEVKGDGHYPFSESELEKEMKEAAARAAEDIRPADPSLQGKEPTIDPKTFDGASRAEAIAEDAHIPFKEVHREYALDTPLPFVAQERSRTLSENANQIFKPESGGYYRHRRTGSFDPKAAYRVAVGDSEVFKTPHRPEKPEGVGLVALDHSGSMGEGLDSKLHYACEAAGEIEYAFREHIPLKIIAFDERGGTVIHEVIKEFDEVQQENCSYNFFAHARGGWSNADFADIRICADELLARKEKEKILIVISDGLPCSLAGFKGKPQDLVKGEVDRAHAAGIRVVGIYIADNIDERIRAAYESMYGGCVVFTDIDNISNELARVMTTWANTWTN